MANGAKGTARGKAAGAILRIAVAAAIVMAGLSGCDSSSSPRAQEARKATYGAVARDGEVHRWDIVRVDGRWFDPVESNSTDGIVTYMKCGDGSVWFKVVAFEQCEVRFDAEGEDGAWAEYDCMGYVMTLHLPRSAEG